MHDHELDHSHEHSHGDLVHSHGHGHEHGHVHSKEEITAITNRLSRAIGHLNSVKQMVADGRDCSEVLIQLSAVRSALNNVGLLVLQSHIEHCLVEAVQHGDAKAVEDLNRAIARYLK